MADGVWLMAGGSHHSVAVEFEDEVAVIEAPLNEARSLAVIKWSEGYIFETLREKYILGDTTRLVEVHHVQGLAHAAGMLIAYLPHEKILVEADLYTPPGPGRPLPDRPNASARSLYRNVQRLGLDVETIVPIHGRPGPWSQFAEWVEAAQ